MSKEAETGNAQPKSKRSLDLQKSETPSVAEKGDMDRYGIQCIAVPYYLYGNFRYTQLQDAVAQAKRDAGTTKSS